MPAETLRAPTPGTGEFQALASERSAPVTAPAARRPALTRDQLWVGAFLLALTLGSLAIRTYAIHVHFWIDEGLSVGIASHPLSKIPALLRQDGSPPLYYLMLHVWMSAFGHGEAATHAFSLVFALLSIPTAYWAGSSLFNRKTGVIAALFAAGLPYLTTYAQETRMYALVALLSLIVAGSFVHAFVLRHRRYLPVFVASLTAELYTHNWGLFLGLMAAVALLVCIRAARGPERRALWIDGALAFGAVGLLYLPWLPTVVYQARHTGAPWDLPPVIWSLSQSGYVLVGGRGGAMLLLIAAGAGFAELHRRMDAPRTSLLAATCLFLLGVGTLLAAWLYSKHTPAWAFRYLGMIVGPLILLFAFGVSRAGRLGFVALALTLCFWVLDPQRHNPNWKSNLAGAIAQVRSDIRPDSLVLSTQPEQVPTLAYYLPDVKRFGTPLGPVPDPRIMDWRNALARFRRSSIRSTLMPMLGSLRPGQTVALVFPLNLAKAPEWMVRINDTSDEWNAALEHDPQLRFRATTVYGMTGSGLAVRISVYAKR